MNPENGSAPQGDVALLVDWENLKFSLLQRERRPSVTALRLAAERFGRIVYARAYADWQDPVHQGDPASLYMAGLEPVYVLTRRYNEGGDIRIKNSVDVKLAADCIEASHQFPNINTYIIVTGDHGFLHIVNTLRPHGKRVVIIGVSWTTSAQLTEQADVVLYYDLDVERERSSDESEVPETPPVPAAATKKLSPQMAQTSETAMGNLRADGTSQEVDQRKLAEILDMMVTITKEYRRDHRDLSVSILGQELAKRMNPADFQRHARGRARPLAQALAAHHAIKLITRNFVDWIYLPEEPDEMIAVDFSPAPEPPRYTYGGFIYADLPPEKREDVIRAVYDERHKQFTDYLTFKRLMLAVGPVVGREELDVKNLVNNMVDIGILRTEAERHQRDNGSGASYAFKTFAVDLQHPDVRKALHLG